VILEHRYYGDSWPTTDLSTKNLRFLTTEQAMADTAYFAQHVVFKGLEGKKLNAPHVPWIAYGGSYAGAFVAFLRTTYPHIFFGAISSSGVTEAIYDYWQYFEPIRQYAPADCVKTTQTFTHLLDNLLAQTKAKPELIQQYKELFGVENLTYDNDFASLLSTPLGYWQSRNWDPAVNDPTFFEYCDAVTNDSVIYKSTLPDKLKAESLIAAGGYGNQKGSLINPLLNFIGFMNETFIADCLEDATADHCFSTHNKTFYAQDDISQQWRSWPYQYCTE
jgi:hypothetical protein